MSYLERLRQQDAKKEIRGEGVPPKLTESPFVGFVGGVPPPVGNFEALPLTPEHEAARRALLELLANSPDAPRAFVNRFEGGTMLITLGVRGVGACELAIPHERFDADTLGDYDRLAACILNAAGSA